MTEAEEQTRIRIRLSIAAYAYEVGDTPVMSDSDYDSLSLEVDTAVRTGNDMMDDFFANRFSADTGMWIHDHPELYKVRDLYEKYYH